MSELEVITAAAGGFVTLLAVLGFIAVRTGMLEGSVALKIVPLSKRRAPELKAEPAAEGDGVAKLPERGAA